MIKNIKDIPKGELHGRRVLLRLDLNVPFDDKGAVADDFRIRKALPTMTLLHEAGAKIRIISHASSTGVSLRPVAEYITKELGYSLAFISDMFHPQATLLLNQQNEGDMALFENIRRHPGEEQNDPDFARILAAMGDVYVNDAFSVSHRQHTSIVGVPGIIPGYAGVLFMSEVEHLRTAFSPPRPFVFILGGAKFETKLPLLAKFTKIADQVVVGGAIANELFEEQGLVVGDSLTTKDTNLHQSEILERANLYLPRDAVINSDNGKETKDIAYIAEHDTIADIGPRSLKEVEEIVKRAAFVLWNGPFGNYEAGFVEGTEALAQIIAGCSAKSIVGGGDTLAAIKKLRIEDKFTFVSTAGGAMLDFLADETLVGIEALDIE